MSQAIAGVTPSSVQEATVMTVWPSNGAFLVGRLLGRLYESKLGLSVFTLGNLVALISIPVALAIFFYRILPFVGVRYRLTNRRLVVQRGIEGEDEKWVELDNFDEIDIVVQPGQAWYDAGDLVFRTHTKETFRLAGVSRPIAFRAVCLKARAAYVGVNQALASASS